MSNDVEILLVIALFLSLVLGMALFALWLEKRP